MSTPPPLVANPENELMRVLGSPAGHALAAKVDDACRLVTNIEISDEEYARRHHWVPPISVGVILAQVMRPSVFIIQQAVDPSFHRTGYGAFEFPYSTIKLLQHALRKVMELVHLISLTDPEYPSYVAIWDGESAVHLMPDEPPVSDQSMGQFEILEYMVERWRLRMLGIKFAHPPPHPPPVAPAHRTLRAHPRRICQDRKSRTANIKELRELRKPKILPTDPPDKKLAPAPAAAARARLTPRTRPSSPAAPPFRRTRHEIAYIQ
ncbi:hypothetical protein B0H16DRAFT_1749092 [Mycena metata]|uniref:Uncharacterized protein n=1 Tax=Mycena metata TaxID=1033252 RepID=A0AAD7DUS0_9AGAR|nr:hypothetical protein B0H16DRAFT_1749092 [Mycena metata]